MLIIGCGNRQRGDDGAGIIAVERLRALGIPAKICTGESSELIDAWSGADDVVVIDAVVTGAPTGTVHVWDGQHPMRPSRPSASTHGIGVAEAIELARTLGRLPPKLRVLGIEGKTFKMGNNISPEVERAVEHVVERIAREVGAAK
ncbi:MAG TPA: hydrogenase maturation protease [Candidatus Acidoferrales bacterium]|nr:hydrogenase maturation protease [Candidatus Acidoferrales bacterium]